MAVLVYPRTNVHKPDSPCIRWGHPLAKDLRLLLLFNAGYLPIDLVNDITFSYGTTAKTVSTGLFGRQLSSSDVAQAGVVSTTQVAKIVPTNGEITVAHWQKWTGDYTAGGTFAFGPDSNVPNRCACSIPWTNGDIIWDYGDVPTNRLSVAHPTPVAGVYYFVVLRSSAKGGTNEIFVNGRQLAQGSSPAASISLASATAYYVGAVAALNNIFFTGVTTYHAVWGRALSPSEIMQLYVRPFSIIGSPKPLRLAAAAPVGPVNNVSASLSLFN